MFIHVDSVGDGDLEIRRTVSYPPLQISGLTRTRSAAGGRDGDGGDVLRVRSPTNSSSATTVSGGGRVRWTEEEVEYLKEGVERFGIGNWKAIRQNYSFHRRRTNVDLKDKWRNLQKRQE